MDPTGKEMIPNTENLVDQEPDDWLPHGWTVKCRIRRDGKRDKFYFSPSDGMRFNSKVGVCRYLGLDPKTVDHSPKASTPHVQSNPSTVCQNLSPEASNPNPGKKTISKRLKPVLQSTPSEKNESRSITEGGDSSLQKVVFERAEAEGLPPGWIKEIKIQKIRGKIRRDPYFTDPVCGYVFRSLKDSLRYIETGEPGRLAIKPKSPDTPETMKLVGKKRKSLLVDVPVLKSNVSAADARPGPIQKSGKKSQLGGRSTARKSEPSLPRRSSGRIAAINERTEVQITEQASKNRMKSIANTEVSKTKRFNQPETTSGPTGRNTGDGNKSRSKSSLLSSYEESWLDPCIDFAVKTLTGTNATEKDLSVNDYIGDGHGAPPNSISNHALDHKLSNGKWNGEELPSINSGMSGIGSVQGLVGSPSSCNWVKGTDRSLFR